MKKYVEFYMVMIVSVFIGFDMASGISIASLFGLISLSIFGLRTAYRLKGENIK